VDVNRLLHHHLGVREAADVDAAVDTGLADADRNADIGRLGGHRRHRTQQGE